MTAKVNTKVLGGGLFRVIVSLVVALLVAFMGVTVAQAEDDWHDENGLPNYGVRIVLDDSSSGSDNTGDNGLGLDIRVRATSGGTTDGVVLEKYRWNSNENKYYLDAGWHFTVPTNNWGSESYDTDDQNAWYWYDGFNYRTWQTNYYGTYVIDNTYSYNGSNWFTTSPGVFDYNQKSTSWQRMVLMLHAFGSQNYFGSDYTFTASDGNSYGHSDWGNGYFSSSRDVYVLRAADTSNVETALTYNSNEDKSVVAPASSASYEYEIQGTRYGYYGVMNIGQSSSADNPQSITEWTSIGTGAYGDFTGARTIPTDGVETIDLTVGYRYNSNELNRKSQSWVSDQSWSNISASDTSGYVIVRNDASDPSETLPVSATVYTSTDNYNTTTGWGNPNYQLNVHAAVYTYDETSQTYTYKNQVVGDTGIHLGSQTSYSRINTTLADDEALVIRPMSTLYAFTYDIETGTGSKITSAKVYVNGAEDGTRGSVNNAFSTYSTYSSGSIANFAPYDSSVAGEEVVLSTTSASTITTPVLASNTFTRLTSDNVGDGLEVRSLKVNLFDYDIPDDWHFTTGNNNSQGDLQFRFVSDSDGGSNLQDPAVNLVNSMRRKTPYTGIVESTLDSNGLPVFNYTAPFASQGGLFSTAEATVTEQGNASAGTDDQGNSLAYKWAIGTAGTTQSYNAAGGAGDLIQQLAEPDSAQTWYNDANGTEEKTYKNIRTKEAYADVDFDFIYQQSTGYYSYNSSKNHAQYDAGANAVYEYDHALGMGGNLNKWSYGVNWGSYSYEYAVTDTNGVRAAGFFPFDSWESAVSETGYDGYGSNLYNKQYAFKPAWNSLGTTLLRKEEDLDYHFGMSTTQEFAIPEGGQVKNADMVFSFSGDDDFWLFVDGQLVLDIGGIHESCPGSINFTRGTYTVGSTTYSLSDIFAGYDDEYPTSDNEGGSGDWAAGTIHSFSLFYLERGGTFSNLSIEFNLPLVSAQAEKVWDNDVLGDDAASTQGDVVLYLEETEGELTSSSTWTEVEGSERTIKADATGNALHVVWTQDEYPMMRYDGATSSNVAVHYRVREKASSLPASYTSAVQVYNSVAETWVDEDDDAYAQAIDSSETFRVTNTYEYTSLEVTKIWNDSDNVDGLRPDSVTVSVLGNGSVVQELTLSAENDWHAAISVLPRYDEDGTEIAYTVWEDVPNGYTADVSGNAAGGYTITNTHTPGTSDSSDSSDSSDDTTTTTTTTTTTRTGGRSVAATGDTTSYVLPLALVAGAAVIVGVGIFLKKRQDKH